MLCLCSVQLAPLSSDYSMLTSAQAAGKYRQEGKNYTVNDGDVRSRLHSVILSAQA